MPRRALRSSSFLSPSVGAGQAWTKEPFHLDFMICMEGLLFFSVVILSPLFPKAWAIKLDYFISVLYPESRMDQKQECI